MLVAKCYDVRLRIGSEWIECAPDLVLLHDPEGTDWPRQSCLISHFKRDQKTHVLTPTPEQMAWAVDPERVRRGTVALPPVSLGAWRVLGNVSRIDYVRHGQHAGSYTHDFPTRKLFVFKQDLPVLYQRRFQLRLDLPHGAEITWRGFVPG